MPPRRRPSTSASEARPSPPSPTRSAGLTLTEPEARAELAAGRALPLAWLWLLGDARIADANPQERGQTMKVRITDDAKPQGQ